MITNKQLKFALEETQRFQRQSYGTNKCITITTACDTYEFIVIVEYGYKKLDDGNCQAIDRTFEFTNSITEDQCVDYLQDIEKLSIKK